MSLKTILLNPGPVNTSRKVKQALLRGDLCHREHEFAELLLKVRKNLLKVFGIEKDYTAIFLTGSGTAALEAAILSTLDARRKVLVLSNGVYGDRIDRIMTINQFPNTVIRVPVGEPLPLEEIDRVLSRDSQIETVAMVHHETSSGMINPVTQVSRLKGMKGRRMIVDSISGLGGEPIHLKKDHIQVCVGTANKCIQGLPGISFVLLQRKELARLKNLPSRSLYLDLQGYWEEQKAGGVSFTPSIQTFYALDAALEEFLKEGLRNRIKRYQGYARRLRHGFERLGLEYFIDSKYHSNSLTALKLPKGVTYEYLHDRLKSNGFVIYAGQGSLKRQIFRVANMGALTLKDLDLFLKCLGSILKS